MSRLRKLRRRPQFQSLDRRAVMDADGIGLELDNDPIVEVGEVADVGNVADADASLTVDWSFDKGVLPDEGSLKSAITVDGEPGDSTVVLDESENAVVAIRGGIAPNFRTLGDAEDSGVVDVSGEVVELGEVQTLLAVGADDVAYEFSIMPVDDMMLEDGELDPSVLFQSTDEKFQTTVFSLSGDDDSISSDDEAGDNTVVLDESENAVVAIRGGIAPNFRTLGDAEDSGAVDVSGEVVELGEVQTLLAVGADDVAYEFSIMPVDDMILEDGELDPSVIFQTTGVSSDTPDDAPVDDTIDGELDPDAIFQTTGAPSDDSSEENEPINGEFVITSTPARDFDVNRNGSVTPLDALLIINSLARYQRQASPASIMSTPLLPTETNASMDVNKDSRVTPSDALLVINQIARSQSSVRQGIKVGEPNGSTESELSSDESTDELPLGDSRIAGYTTLTITGLGSAPVVLNVNDQGEIEAISDGESLEVKVGDDDSLFVEGQATPVRRLRLADLTYIVPTSESTDDITVAWPNAVDDVMSQWA
jgi:ketosteroid isomerase-like protein